MKILVTGGAGFIGSHIVDLLIEKGHKVIVLDNLSTGKKENLNPKASFYEMDIGDNNLRLVFEKEKPEIICHHAAQIDVRISTSNPIFDAQQNILGSLNVLENAKRFNVKKIIFASTGGAIYGEQSYFPADEEHPQNPVSPYGIAKLAVEKYLYYYYNEYGIKYTALRYANVYGPRQNDKGEAGVVAIFTSKMLKNEDPVIYGDGEQTRDFVYVGDVAKYNLLAVEKDVTGVFNIGSTIETSVNTVFNVIKQHANPNAKEIHGNQKPGEQRRSVITYDKALKTFAYKPSIDFNVGIHKTVDWFKEHCR
ncbi:MAG: NAD-dependent epimerase/dehydratase family protein [Spirochaetota bacterium]|nr:NAD-dependent epimerase/dehydratase family protein [Spirochaetota bacterium]